MRKINKTPIIILLCLAITLLIAAGMLLFIPEPRPLKVTQDISVTKTQDGNFAFSGKIKNVTQDAIILDESSFEIELQIIETSGSKKFMVLTPNNPITIQSEGELDLATLVVDLSEAREVKITKIKALEGRTFYTLYGSIINSGLFLVLGAFAGLIGGTLLILTGISYYNELRKTKYINTLIGQNNALAGGVYAAGVFGSKSEDKSAVKSSVLSVFGAVISSLLLGFGRYRIHSKNGQTEFIVTKNKIFVYSDNDFENVTNNMKAALANPTVAEKKGKVCIKGENSDLYFNLHAQNKGDKKSSQSELLNNLQNIFTRPAASETATHEQPAADDVTGDVFAEFETADAQTQSQSNDDPFEDFSTEE